MHACNKALQYATGTYVGELYFEDEPAREMRWSYEMEVSLFSSFLTNEANNKRH